MKPSIFISCILSTLAVAGCNKYGAMGQPGSVMWNTTATQQQKASYEEDRIYYFQGRCKLLGYKDEREIAQCANEQFNAERDRQAANRARSKQSVIDSLGAREDRKAQILSGSNANNNIGYDYFMRSMESQKDCVSNSRGYSCY